MLENRNHLRQFLDSGNIDIAEYLLLVGYELDEKDRHLGFTPLARAVKSGIYHNLFFLRNNFVLDNVQL